MSKKGRRFQILDAVEDKLLVENFGNNRATWSRSHTRGSTIADKDERFSISKEYHCKLESIARKEM